MATDYNKLKVTELKVELKRLGLPQNGLKADLVARLEAVATDPPTSDTAAASAAEDDDDQVQEALESGGTAPPEMDPTPAAETDAETAIRPEETSLQDAPMTDVPALNDTGALPEDSAPEPAQPIAATDFAVSNSQPPSSIAPESSSSATPVRPIEIVQDSQKRKRRSLSPAPRAEDIAAKRARLSSEQPEAEVGLSETENKEEAIQMFGTARDAPTDAAMGGAQSEISAEQQTRADSVASTVGITQSLRQKSPDDADQPMMDDTKQQSQLDNDTVMGESLADTLTEEELQGGVEPSTHPATSALYIKNFMRPLRPQAVKDHLLDLATPAGVEIDDQTIPDFYLDNIRTHSFVLFNSVTAAKRVRNALHNQVWPDETNRKPLWIDYIPSERYHDWVAMEQSAGGGRGSASRYEVVYEHDRNGNVIAALEESGAAPPAAKPAPMLERKQSVPTGPSRGLTGIEGAPTGPRGLQGGGRAPVHHSRLDRVVDHKSSIARPTVAYQPVPEELARRRQDAIKMAKSRDYDQRSDKNKEYRRYFFEHGDHLVDRGPEIFLGIRPPHRERERERHQEHGHDDRRRGGRGRRNGRRGGMPMHHGVPKGGDRYRGTAASGDYNDRGGDRYRGESYGRH
ncbi:hypothetical protein SCUP515_11527 [Seiridium cupressi]